MRNLRALGFAMLPVLATGMAVGCGTSPTGTGFGGTSSGGVDSGPPPGPGFTDGGALGQIDGSAAGDGGRPGAVRDPVTCAEAETSKSYVGCDYWPTITPNPVWNVFDFAVVVANAGAQPASITVTGPNGVNKVDTVAPGQLKKVYLPWVPGLKGGDASECGAPPALSASAVVSGGAYHLTSSVPVIVYQFNALEYKGAGGDVGKSWATCPGTVKACAQSG